MVWNWYQRIAKTKSVKGTVKVESYINRLRMRWSYAGKRFTLSLGLPDSQINRAVAERKKLQIELDMALGDFDPTLKKYSPEPIKKPTKLTINQLFERYLVDRATYISSRTKNCYECAGKLSTKFFKQKPAHRLTFKEVETFIAWLTPQDLSSYTKRSYIHRAHHVWQWAIEQELFEGKNPW